MKLWRRCVHCGAWHVASDGARGRPHSRCFDCERNASTSVTVRTARLRLAERELPPPSKRSREDLRKRHNSRRRRQVCRMK